MDDDSEELNLASAAALADYADAGGYDQEVLFDACCMAALDLPWDKARWRETSTLSGGEQKRLALEVLLRGHDEVLLLDEPDNYLDVPAKRWLEGQLRATRKTVLLVSHDRELLANAATAIAALELGGGGNTLWVHGDGDRRDARPLVRPRVRSLPGVRLGRRRLRGVRTGLGRGARGPRPVSRLAGAPGRWLVSPEWIATQTTCWPRAGNRPGGDRRCRPR
ncbi:ATP-binding cassette domain-containing protein [Propioniciclava tarda]|uniref:ATP-binding cassette domain-containing protein n=1 Tax=Propioniciclava tarda TaxID=433330 RepID=A0A4Q9KMK3_PROTD|nr:ATP-binding cassette domain-containing protein [Propioniciclava tarda]SMO39937.1 ABC transporter [Propioniciclava tarda]